MRIDGAIVREQHVTFAIVVVKASAISSAVQAEQVRDSLKTIADFQNLPLVLASQDASGRFTYQGRPDIVEFLAAIDARRIPWKTYTVR